ncbi:hypothetical protein CEXT_397631 [Caerostris extrusa]|uniref:Uncharacterized protein n=1 Tax=Caerostris extrusa TaxID=172846 RepID=A0AAV4MZ84_CAEEX|nr:hypothetical protein CEXT_397631 [Caerostris extrusa]
MGNEEDFETFKSNPKKMEVKCYNLLKNQPLKVLPPHPDESAGTKNRNIDLQTHNRISSITKPNYVRVPSPDTFPEKPDRISREEESIRGL